MDLSTIIKLTGNKRKKKRIGRGCGSGKGFHTVGRGMKGQKARVGKTIPMGFEGGQIPLYKKLPTLKRFKMRAQKDIVAVNISRLKLFDADAEVTPQSLVDKGILKLLPKHGVKLIGHNKLNKKLKLSGFLTSKALTNK